MLLCVITYKWCILTCKLVLMKMQNKQISYFFDFPLLLICYVWMFSLWTNAKKKKTFVLQFVLGSHTIWLHYYYVHETQMGKAKYLQVNKYLCCIINGIIQKEWTDHKIFEDTGIVRIQLQKYVEIENLRRAAFTLNWPWHWRQRDIHPLRRPWPTWFLFFFFFFSSNFETFKDNTRTFKILIFVFNANAHIFKILIFSLKSQSG